MLVLQAVPDYLISENMYVEFTPIDEAAGAVMTLTRHFNPQKTIFHINSTRTICLNAFIDYFNTLGFQIQIVDEKTFTSILHNTSLDKEEALSAALLIRDLEPVFISAYLQKMYCLTPLMQ